METTVYKARDLESIRKVLSCRSQKYYKQWLERRKILNCLQIMEIYFKKKPQHLSYIRDVFLIIFSPSLMGTKWQLQLPTSRTWHMVANRKGRRQVERGLSFPKEVKSFLDFLTSLYVQVAKIRWYDRLWVKWQLGTWGNGKDEMVIPGLDKAYIILQTWMQFSCWKNLRIV